MNNFFFALSSGDEGIFRPEFFKYRSPEKMSIFFQDFFHLKFDFMILTKKFFFPIFSFSKRESFSHKKENFLLKFL